MHGPQPWPGRATWRMSWRRQTPGATNTHLEGSCQWGHCSWRDDSSKQAFWLSWTTWGCFAVGRYIYIYILIVFYGVKVQLSIGISNRNIHIIFTVSFIYKSCPTWAESVAGCELRWPSRHACRETLRPSQHTRRSGQSHLGFESKLRLLAWYPHLVCCFPSFLRDSWISWPVSFKTLVNR